MKLNGEGTPIKIKTSNVDLGETLPRTVEDRILHVAERSSGQVNHAAVGFSREGHSYCCIINIQIGNLKVIVAEASAADCQRAFEQALGKIEKQLRRRKHRALDVGGGQMPIPALA